jgi:hypothetical protein
MNCRMPGDFGCSRSTAFRLRPLPSGMLPLSAPIRMAAWVRKLRGIVGWDVCFNRSRAQKQTDSHRPRSDLV